MPKEANLSPFAKRTVEGTFSCSFQPKLRTKPREMKLKLAPLSTKANACTSYTPCKLVCSIRRGATAWSVAPVHSELLAIPSCATGLSASSSAAAAAESSTRAQPSVQPVAHAPYSTSLTTRESPVTADVRASPCACVVTTCARSG